MARDGVVPAGAIQVVGMVAAQAVRGDVTVAAVAAGAKVPPLAGLVQGVKDGAELGGVQADMFRVRRVPGALDQGRDSANRAVIPLEQPVNDALVVGTELNATKHVRQGRAPLSGTEGARRAVDRPGRDVRACVAHRWPPSCRAARSQRVTTVHAAPGSAASWVATAWAVSLSGLPSARTLAGTSASSAARRAACSLSGAGSARY